MAAIPPIFELVKKVVTKNPQNNRDMQYKKCQRNITMKSANRNTYLDRIKLIDTETIVYKLISKKIHDR